MTRLSFGLLCAQSAALFCLERAIMDSAICASNETVLKTLISFYVDDGLFSFANVESLITFFKEIGPLLLSHGFPLTKYFTNCSSHLELILKDDLASVKSLNLENGKLFKMRWALFGIQVLIAFSLLVHYLIQMLHVKELFQLTVTFLLPFLGCLQPYILFPKILIRELNLVKLDLG